MTPHTLLAAAGEALTLVVAVVLSYVTLNLLIAGAAALFVATCAAVKIGVRE